MLNVRVPPTLEVFINTYDNFIITGHKEPDGDCIGSMFAMSGFLNRIKGKKTLLLNAGPFKRPEIKEYEPLTFSAIPDSFPRNNTGCIILDCSNMARTGDVEPLIRGFPSFIIDHHASNGETGGNSFVNPSSPSTTLLVYQVIESLGYKPDHKEAELLFFGLSTDSGFFRHLDENSALVFFIASKLIECGANPKQTFLKMNGGKSPESRKLLSVMLSRVEYYYGGRLAVTWEELEDTRLYGLEGRDSDMLYQLIQSVRGVKAIIAIRQETEDNCTVGFRSLDEVDVGKIAESFGGGGHKQASGLSIKGTVKGLKPVLIEAFKDSF